MFLKLDRLLNKKSYRFIIYEPNGYSNRIKPIPERSLVHGPTSRTNQFNPIFTTLIVAVWVSLHKTQLFDYKPYRLYT